MIPIPELVEGLPERINEEMGKARKLDWPERNDYIISRLFPLLDQALLAGYNVVFNEKTALYELVPMEGEVEWESPQIKSRSFKE